MNKLNNELLTTKLKKLQKKLNYQFKDINLLKLALTHKSFSSKNNERLEFLGDSILNYSIARLLFDYFPKITEGELSRARASLVNQEKLAYLARGIKLGDVLLLGMGEMKSGGFNRDSILSDTLEAILAAICLDSNFEEAQNIIKILYNQEINDIDIIFNNKDAKSLLQEKLQAKHNALPNYNIIKQDKINNELLFTIECKIESLDFKSQATAKSKKQAEQESAKIALEYLENYDKK